MRASQFLDMRKKAWEKAETLVKKAQKRGLTSLGEEGLHRLVRVYPALIADVARARMHGLDRRTRRRVNNLAIAVHGLIYRPERTSYVRAVVKFLTTRYPRIFRRTWVYLALAVVIFFAGSLGTYASVRLRPSRAYAFVPGKVDIAESGGEQGLTPKDVSQRFRRIPNPPIAAGVITNNIGVAIMAFAFGIFAGLGTAYVLLVNSMMLGGFAAHFANHGLGGFFLAFVAPHGCLEILAILIAAAAGLRLGGSLAVPGNLPRSTALREGAKEAVFMLLGTVPMFVVAGLLEGFVTPSRLSQGARLVIGLGVLGITLVYLTAAGRKGQDAEETSGARAAVSVYGRGD